jgi:hypothetical protein
MSLTNYQTGNSGGWLVTTKVISALEHGLEVIKITREKEDKNLIETYIEKGSSKWRGPISPEEAIENAKKDGKVYPSMTYAYDKDLFNRILLLARMILAEDIAHLKNESDSRIFLTANDYGRFDSFYK